MEKVTLTVMDALQEKKLVRWAVMMVPLKKISNVLVIALIEFFSTMAIGEHAWTKYEVPVGPFREPAVSLAHVVASGLDG